jgi:ribosomal RNA-processing protein 12
MLAYSPPSFYCTAYDSIFDTGSGCVDDDEPTDLLRGAASRITSAYLIYKSNVVTFNDKRLLDAQSSRRRKPGQEAAHFKLDDDTGKMIIDESSEDEATGVQGTTAATDVAGTAYRESITAVDGFTRGSGGRVKFYKDTKKRRRENADVDDDVEMVDGDVRLHKTTKPKGNARFGHEYKAKVCLLFFIRVSCF